MAQEFTDTITAPRVHEWVHERVHESLWVRWFGANGNRSLHPVACRGFVSCAESKPVVSYRVSRVVVPAIRGLSLRYGTVAVAAVLIAGLIPTESLASPNVMAGSQANLAPSAQLSAQVLAARSDGIVTGAGIAAFRGSPGPNAPARLVAMAGLRDGSGYWVARSDGAVSAHGNARRYGSVSAANLSTPVVAMSPHPDGRGYWLVTAGGHVYAFGSAQWFGQPIVLAAPAIGIAPTPTGKGYWIAAGDGGVFAYGDAGFFGSAYGAVAAHGGAAAFTSAMTGSGYWVVARDGALYPFGTARNFGSTWPAPSAVAGIASTRSGAGYSILETSGRVRVFGDAATSNRLRPRDDSHVGPRSSGGHYSPPLPPTADVPGAVRSVTVPLDRRAVAIAGAGGFHSFWILADPLAPTATMAALGASGPVVQSLQYNLLARGFWLNLTGTFDSQTLQAVWAFQKTYDRSRTGVVSADDYRKLVSAPRHVPRSPTGYVAEIDKARQIIILARDGRAEWIFNTSTGNDKPYTYDGVTQIATTRTGRFTMSRQIDGLRVGRLGSLWRPKYFTSDGIAFHGSASIPPYPASHGCARLSNLAIDFIWASNAIPLGTSVYVY